MIAMSPQNSQRARGGMARLTPRFSSNRAVREYTEQYSLPVASAYRKRTADKGALGMQVVNWQHALEQKWAALRFGEVKVETNGEQHVFGVQVYLNDLDPAAVRVELYADGVMGSAPVRQEMKRVRKPARARRRCLQRAMSADRSPAELYGASDTALRQRGDPVGRRTKSCGSDEPIDGREVDAMSIGPSGTRGLPACSADHRKMTGDPCEGTRKRMQR